jgi:hypothetical protein
MLGADQAASYRADEARGCAGRGRRMAEIRRAGEPAEALWDEFEGSMGKLGPLREKIRQTDELIDVVVYRLYGLTEEEIRLIDGTRT